MRITQLTPGTGHFYCGNCLRDSALGHGLRGLGHDVTMLPLYLPLHTEHGLVPEPKRVFLGGINVYMQHKLRWWGRLPAFVRRPLDGAGLLRWSSKRGDMTDAAKHADLTIAMLRGEDGLPFNELHALMNWMREHDPPDIVLLCNALLTGLAKPIRQALDAKVLVTLHGEDAYLDSLPGPKREEAWATLREAARHADAFIAVSAFYGDAMRARLDLDPARVHVIHNGIHIDDIGSPAQPDADRPPTIGYLARMCPDKGLHTLIDAFIELHRRASIEDLQLRVAGVMLKADRRFVADLKARLSRASCLDRATFMSNITREEKLEFLRSIDVLSVPATYGEAFGLYVLEALTHGVPVVQPRHGAFPELLERTGGGVLCEPDDPISLADGLEEMLVNRDAARSLGEAGRQTVLAGFTSEHMARRVADLCTLLLEGGAASKLPAIETPQRSIA